MSVMHSPPSEKPLNVEEGTIRTKYLVLPAVFKVAVLSTPVVRIYWTPTWSPDCGFTPVAALPTLMTLKPSKSRPM